MYDGAPYLGFADHGRSPTVEAELARVLTRLLGEKPLINAASRTDRGVHAKGQVVNFKSAKIPSLRQLNGLLPPSIRVLSLALMPESFHATIDAKGKTYQYAVSLGPVQSPFERYQAYHVPTPLDLSLMAQSAQKLLGTHDFTAFANQNPTQRYDKTCRLDNISFGPEEGRLLITVTGARFLYKMVRNIVGTLIDIGRGKLSDQDFLGGKDRTRCGITAPAHGLTLERVYYD